MEPIFWVIVVAIVIVVLFGGYTVYGGDRAAPGYVAPGYGPGLGLLGTLLVVVLIIWLLFNLPSAHINP